LAKLAVATMVGLASLLPTQAYAQLPDPPPYPDMPEVTEPLEANLDQVADQFVPFGNTVAEQTALAGKLAGPTLRPACAAVGVAVVATVLGGGYFPFRVPAGKAASPVQYFCTNSYFYGTLDYRIDDVDAVAGPPVTQVNDTVIVPASEQLAPIHEQAAAGCGFSPLVGSPAQQVPRPVNRLDLVRLICG
jgi:hypothetical protein